MPYGPRLSPRQCAKVSGFPADVRVRKTVYAADVQIIARLVESTGFFSPAEQAIAVELVAEYLHKGMASGYAFVLLERDHGLIGYTCFGLIPGTLASFDLYWIAIAPHDQGQGLGRALLAYTEGEIYSRGGQRIYVETSSRPQYQATRGFYQRAGYHPVAQLPDFYAPSDGKIIYAKVLADTCEPARASSTSQGLRAGTEGIQCRSTLTGYKQ